MAKVRKQEDIEIGERLQRTREALGYPVRRAFAKLMEIPEGNIEKWENGDAKPRVAFVNKMRFRWHVTFDWIYGGHIDGLPHDLAVKVLEAMEAGKAQPTA